MPTEPLATESIKCQMYINNTLYNQRSGRYSTISGLPKQSIDRLRDIEGRLDELVGRMNNLAEQLAFARGQLTVVVHLLKTGPIPLRAGEVLSSGFREIRDGLTKSSPITSTNSEDEAYDQPQ